MAQHGERIRSSVYPTVSGMNDSVVASYGNFSMSQDGNSVMTSIRFNALNEAEKVHGSYNDHFEGGRQSTRYAERGPHQQHFTQVPHQELQQIQEQHFPLNFDDQQRFEHQHRFHQTDQHHNHQRVQQDGQLHHEHLEQLNQKVHNKQEHQRQQRPNQRTHTQNQEHHPQNPRGRYHLEQPLHHKRGQDHNLRMLQSSHEHHLQHHQYPRNHDQQRNEHHLHKRQDHQSPQQRHVELPLRILVQNDLIGAIIGRGGQTIRQISQETRARVDVNKKEATVGGIEKAVTIYGQPENCTNACFEILKVISEEMTNSGKTDEVCLKILAHNNLIGRIIGKQGVIVKRLMDETGSKITVSSIGEISAFNVERAITIRGTLEQISKAEAEISAKLRAAYESDLQNSNNQMFSPLNTRTASTTGAMHNRGLLMPNDFYGGLLQSSLNGYGGFNCPLPLPVFGNLKHSPPMGPPFLGPHANLQQETTAVFIPNGAVGAMIGTKGTHIRNIIQLSGASMKIAQEPEDVTRGYLPNQSPERRITIVGNLESQWKAQYLIFEKIREDGYGNGSEARLTVEIVIPSSQVGRIIGKGGATVKELQRTTNALIKLPEQLQTGSITGEDTPVHISGNFFAVQAAKQRIRAIVQPPNQPISNGNGSNSQ